MKRCRRLFYDFWSLKCPQCRAGELFKSRISLAKKCQSCGFPFQGGSEGWAGAALINYSLTVLIVIFLVFIGILTTGFDHLEIIAVSAVLVGMLCNFFIYRYAHSFWLHLLYCTKMAEDLHT